MVKTNIITFVIGFLLGLAVIKCRPTETVIVKVPEIRETFKTDTVIVHVPVPSKPRTQTQIQYIDRFIQADCEQKKEVFEDFIQSRAFTSTFEDEHLELTIKGIVSGYVEELTPSYVIKARTMQTTIPQPKNRALFAFGTLGVNHTSYGGGLGYMNKRTVYQLHYEPDRILFSVGIPIIRF